MSDAVDNVPGQMAKVGRKARAGKAAASIVALRLTSKEYRAYAAAAKAEGFANIGAWLRALAERAVALPGTELEAFNVPALPKRRKGRG